jgi:hypothetical protein
MLSVKKYTKEHVSFCKKKIQNDISIFESQKIANADFEQAYFNNMVVVLESMFMHRMRGQEGKDGNPLNEVRMLCGSLMLGQTKLKDDTTIKYVPEKSVAKIKIGSGIEINGKVFKELADKFFKEIERKYS